MSGEYCETSRGFFWQECAEAADEHKSEKDDYGQKLGAIIEEVGNLACEYAYFQASDCGYASILHDSLPVMDRLKAKVAEMDSFLSIYREVGKRAIAEHIASRKGS